jgi:hypothetical protein
MRVSHDRAAARARSAPIDNRWSVSPPRPQGPGWLIECESVSPLKPASVDRRTFLKTAAAGALGYGWPQRAAGAGAPPEILYNGIRAAQPWPPRRRDFTATPLMPPYLVDRPDVALIDVGRQLFVDDFLIESTSLARTFHRPVYHPANPVLRPTTRWEKYDEYAERTKTRSNPAAMVFSDGVFYDPRDRIFKMWYMGGYTQNTCYAVSADGITWDKPVLDVVAGTNIVLAQHRDSSTTWLDLEERDPARRFKMTNWHDHYLLLFVSGDGIHWTEIGRSGPAGDRTTFFYNPFRGVWVFSIRDERSGGMGRYRRYLETPDFGRGAQWREHEPVLWVSSDVEDARRPEYDVPAEIYNLDCVAYESILLGLFTIFRGERNEREKPNDVCAGFSRDGFHWYRPDRRAFLPVSEHVGDWNWANVQSAGGGCLIVGDQLYFYVSGRRGVPGSGDPGICSTGLAILRRDGFASMDFAPPAYGVERIDPSIEPGTLTTRPVRFSGRHLFVNLDAPAGELRVEVLDRDGRAIGDFSAARCLPVGGNHTSARVSWNGAADLSALAGQTVRFRFRLTGGSLYAFWVSPSAGGESGGYVGAGGPGFSGIADHAGARR